MKRIKKLGLAVFTALALTAVVGVAGASAMGFVADKYPAAVEGGPEGLHYLKINHGEQSCTGAKFSGAIEKAGEQPTNTVYNTTCGAYPLNSNGCKFTYRPGTETSPGKYNGTFDIGPAGCGPMSVLILNCKVTIGAQTGLNASYENVGSGASAAVKITANATSLKYTQEDQPNGPHCVTGSYTNGSYTGSWLMKAKDEIGKSIGVHVGVTSGIYLSGEKSEEKAKQPKFDAEAFPTWLLGTQASPELAFNGVKASCTSAAFEGEAATASAETSLGATYSGCTLGSFPATVATNGCQYVAHVLNAGPPYTGTVDIACPAGKSIEVVAKITGVTKCTVTIGSQSGLSGVTLTNTGTGSGRGIEASFGLSGIKYHQQEGTGAGKCSSGDFTNGTYSGTLSLLGYR